jgi:hypothetical protein
MIRNLVLRTIEPMQINYSDTFNGLPQRSLQNQLTRTNQTTNANDRHSML